MTCLFLIFDTPNSEIRMLYLFIYNCIHYDVIIIYIIYQLSIQPSFIVIHLPILSILCITYLQIHLYLSAHLSVILSIHTVIWSIYLPVHVSTPGSMTDYRIHMPVQKIQGKGLVIVGGSWRKEMATTLAFLPERSMDRGAWLSAVYGRSQIVAPTEAAEQYPSIYPPNTPSPLCIEVSIMHPPFTSYQPHAYTPAT